MKKLLIIVMLLALSASSALARESFETRHRISIRIGYHNWFPDTTETEGTRPDDDGVVEDGEWEYIWDQAYRIQDFDSATLELGYEYLFLRWFGLGLDLGIYGNQREYDFNVSGFEVDSRMTINVFHIDLNPRFHWQTGRTDLYGGPLLGLYTASAEFVADVDYGPYSAKFDDSERGDGFGWGLMAGFEVRLNKHFGVALEDRLSFAVIDEFKPDDEGPLNAGGNVLTLSGVVHF
ncbi:MAG: outer membrane beta-barrel protein [Candidatus Alcyoniella australis]|nr:outer membrane beta-barrel protein [Candidatus Alcyoniella australis]